jgi:murein DD-endopeptidase MepM/ murein hydrolase activator NlpD
MLPPKLSEFVTDLREGLSSARNVLSSQDGRWTLVSTSVTASVALTVAWLALAATPPSSAHAYEPRREQAVLPYNLLASLTGGHAVPAIGAEDGRAYNAASLVGAGFNFPHSSGGPLDNALAQERAQPSVESRTLTMNNGDTIIGMLQDAGVTAQDANAVVNAMRPIFSPRSLRTGQVFQARFGAADIALGTEHSEDEALDGSATPAPVRLLSLNFAPSIEREINVKLTGRNEYSAQDIQKKLESRNQHAGATIDSSLYLAAMQAGIPAGVVVELIHMFSYDVDFQRDVHPGDSFEVFFNHFYTPDGQPAKTGDILAATMTLGGKKHTLYRFETEEGAEYFQANGQSAKSMLMKTPVDGARISSGFGVRRHPVLGYTRMHKGIDFAVPTGTPVMAAGSGTVTFAGRQNGYGNFVIVTHGNGYSTAYAHLSRFASGVRKGARVRQGQVVAYTGMTGITTGPHLHYEIRVNGTQANPLKVKVATGRKLGGKDLARFQSERARIEQLAASMPIQTKVADASGLRDTSEQ